MAIPTTREDILVLLRKSGLLKPEVLQKYLNEHHDLPGEPKGIVAQLVQAKLLTSFQAKLLLAGKYRGFRLGAYILLEHIGQGGMGAVYLAVHDTLHRKAAIKVLPPGGNKITVERFLREARAAAALDHPNVVRLHDVGREGQVHFIVMEFVDGQTLDKLVTSTAPIPAIKAVEYIAQACAGLQHAHERGFIHRDIKPANLILAKDGTIKILDMGLARSNDKHDQLTQVLDAGAVVGTADYISPEQAMNDPGVDIRTDIYSLGATFFAIVTGRPPFDGPTASKLVQHQVKDPPSVSTLDRTFPKGLSSVIAKMMAKKPADRYSTPSEVIEALQPWQSESAKVLAGLSQTMVGQTATLSKITGRLTSPEPSKKKNRKWLFAALGGLATAILLGVGIAVAMMFGGGGSRSQSKAGTTPVSKSAPNRVVYSLELADYKPVVVTTQTYMGGINQDLKTYRELKRVPAGAPIPFGWLVRSNLVSAECEMEIAEVDGTKALGIRTTKIPDTADSDPNTAILFTPNVECPSGAANLKFEYQSPIQSGKSNVKIKLKGQPSTVVGALDTPTQGWKSYEQLLDFNQNYSATLEISNGGELGEILWIRNFSITELPPAPKK